jgi:rare lipoprotein A
MESDNIILPMVTEQPFNDVAVNEWFSPYIQVAKDRSILYYTIQNNVYPGIELTRGRFSELVYRYLKNKLDGSMYGKGSYYSDSLIGNGTSSGEPYLATELTAAHRTLPFNTMVEVTNLENGEKVTVRINDRGPYITGRVIDLSRAAFEAIAHPGQGIIYVEYKVLNDEV